MKTPPEAIRAALAKFSNPDESLQEEGFTVISERSRPFLHSMLSRLVPSENDRDDVIQESFQRVWKSRDRLAFETVGSWWCYLTKISHTCAIDHLQSVKTSVSLEDAEYLEIPDSERARIDVLLEVLEDRRMVFRLADEVFLNLPVDMQEAERNRHLFAAKLLVVEKLPWQTVCRIVNSNASERDTITRSDLDRLLMNGSLIRHLVYSELHLENEQLFDFLIEAGCARTDDQARAIRLRYFYGLFLEQIIARLRPVLKKSELISLFDSCVHVFPFVEIMNRLNSNLRPIRGAWDEVVAAGLWHRLVFQYLCHNGLTQRDIFERTSEASKVAGNEVTMAKLNVWLSNGRLFKKLSDHLERRSADAKSKHR